MSPVAAHAVIVTLGTVAAAGGVAAFTVMLFRGLRGLIRLTDDFLGSPGDPGVRDRLRKIEHELHPNRGSSMRDHLMEAIRQVDEKAEHARTAASLAVNEAKAARGIITDRLDEADAERRLLIRALAEHNEQTDVQRRAYVAALLDIGIDLTHVTDELDPEGNDD